jgi:2,4-dienoyl-CoA reductase-like NADH-dependent reductase (Old Yellow Enzyme family)
VLPVDLFSTITIGTVTLRNRSVVAPMTRLSATLDGLVTDRMLTYYEEFASGGWGLVETEATYIDDEHSQCRNHQPGLANLAHCDAWRRVVDAVHVQGAAIFVQLQHAGALAEARRSSADALAPSAVAPRGPKALPVPRELTTAEIAGIQQSFARAAARAVNAGFDGIELHGTNGYLIDQFLTDYSNLRTDSYGGSAANRIRFAAEAIHAVRQVVPSDFPVGVRLNQSKSSDPGYRWPGGEEDARTIFAALVAAGASFVHIAGLNWSDPANGSRMLLAIARTLAGVVVIANGGLDDPIRARDLIATGRTDLVALARGALANPDWPQRVAANRPLIAYDSEMIRPVPTLENADAWRQQQIDQRAPVRS